LQYTRRLPGFLGRQNAVTAAAVRIARMIQHVEKVRIEAQPYRFGEGDVVE
jgi:hypothetical protein